MLWTEVSLLTNTVLATQVFSKDLSKVPAVVIGHTSWMTIFLSPTPAKTLSRDSPSSPDEGSSNKWPDH